jgi:hypothetical protein
MSTYVEECRREWKRLGVPDLMADEMATDLEADLAEAQAEGVSAAEILGESDPRRFAETWASERGLVPEAQPPKKSRKRFWIVLAIVVVVLAFFLGIGAVALLATPRVSTSGPPPVQVSGIPVIPAKRAVRVPPLVGVQACRAVRIAIRGGLAVLPHQPGDLAKDAVVDGKEYSCDAVVKRQSFAPGQVVRRHSQLVLWLGRASG